MISKYEVRSADLNPRFGTEPGKTRPVVVVQTNLLNGKHPSTIICPLTTQVVKGPTLLRIHLSIAESGLTHASDILMDQVRAIDNRRLIRKIGELTVPKQLLIDESLRALLDLQPT